MDERNARSLFHQAGAEITVGAAPTSELVDRGRAARRRVRLASAGTAAALVAMSFGAVAALRSGDDAARQELADAPSAASLLDVTCTGNGTQVAERTVAASADGVHLRVANTTAAEVYLHYETGGQPVPVTGRELVLVAPPGALRIHCGYDMSRRTDPEVEITVVDPAQHYRAIDVDAVLGCPPGGAIVDWVRGGSGATPEAALADFAAFIRRDLSFQDVSPFPAQAERVYAAFENGIGFGAGTVHREGDHWTATIDRVCAGRLDRPER